MPRKCYCDGVSKCTHRILVFIKYEQLIEPRRNYFDCVKTINEISGYEFEERRTISISGRYTDGVCGLKYGCKNCIETMHSELKFKHTLNIKIEEIVY
jgi:hypothetical protein